MLIRNSRIIPYRLPLRAAWRSAQGGFAERRGCLLRLETSDGRVAWGDCAPLPEMNLAGEMASLSQALVGLDPEAAQAWLRAAELHPAVRCAADVALSDWTAQDLGVPLARVLNPDALGKVLCNAALGALDDGALLSAQVARAAGFKVLKLKVGLRSVQEELLVLRQLAADLPTDVSLRLDANRAWGMEDARIFISGLSGLPVEMLEEPLAPAEMFLSKLAALQALTETPLALDESLFELGVESVLEAAPVRRLVLKPMLVGGLQAALVLNQRAAAAGLMCVVTTTVDSAVGTLAALHLAAALNNGLAHGLATSSWLEQDAGLAPQIRDGLFVMGEQAGLGFVPNPALMI